jgi:hypothetical protein
MGQRTAKAPRRRQPEVGDLITVGPFSLKSAYVQKAGLVLDFLELDDGDCNYEVVFDNGEIFWFSDLELVVVNK